MSHKSEYYQRPKKDPKIIHFVRRYIYRRGMRYSPDRSDQTLAQEVIEDLHNLRVRYDKLGLHLKRLDTKRRYYKRVRHDARFASELLEKINSQIDWLRRISEPGDVIQWKDYHRSIQVNADGLNAKQLSAHR